MTYEEWSRIWMETYTLNIKPTTARTYQSILKTHLLPKLSDIELEDISLALLQQTLTSIYRSGTSAKRLRDISGVLHRSLKIAEKLHLIDCNPADDLILPKVERKGIHPLNYLELRSFLDEIAGSRYRLFYYCAVFLGARESEILGLTWDCVDTNRLCVLFEKQLSYYGKGVWNFNTLKNNKIRQVSIPIFLAQVFDDERKLQTVRTRRTLCL